MRGGERAGDLPGDDERVGRESAGRVDGVGKTAAVDQLHHERPDVAALFDPMNGCDVGMIERRQHARLAVEARQPLPILCERSRQDLDRDVAAELRVSGAVDVAHASGADHTGHFVRADASPYGEHWVRSLLLMKLYRNLSTSINSSTAESMRV